MTYERTTSQGIQAWLTTELSTPGWNSAVVAKGLTDEVMATILQQYNEFDSTTKQGILLASLYVTKADFLAVKETLTKVLELACNDTDEFVRITGNVLKDYPQTNRFNLNIEDWSDGYSPLLEKIGDSIKKNGFHFHSPEYMLMQPSARIKPTYAAATFEEYKPTKVQHFSLTDNTKDIISSDERWKCFDELVQSEERLEHAEARTAQAVAQKREQAVKRVVSPTLNTTNPFPFPAAGSNTSAPPRRMSGGPIRNIPQRSSSTGHNPLFTRPPRPAPSGSSSLFITGKRGKPASLFNKTAAASARPTNAVPLPRGLQKEKKTQMLDLSALTQFEHNNELARQKAEEGKKSRGSIASKTPIRTGEIKGGGKKTEKNSQAFFTIKTFFTKGITKRVTIIKTFLTNTSCSGAGGTTRSGCILSTTHLLCIILFFIYIYTCIYFSKK
ncbi:hypothetical protein K501DRAFT_286530 [Backusella circina FSU 941]|nr:hypothetical protein K501DRAFT_286530 [Backusella circina FSU 941]